MGTNVSKQSAESVTKSVSSVMTNISTKVESTNSSYTTSNQAMRIYMGNVRVKGDVNINQTASVTVSTMLENSTKLSNDLTNDLLITIKEQLENELTQANEELNLGQTNVSISDVSSTVITEQMLQTSIESGISNSIKTDTRGNQSLDFYGDNAVIGGDLNISQEMQIESISKNIAESIVENTIANVMDQDIGKAMKNKTEQLNKGLNFDLLIMLAAAAVGAYFVGVKKLKWLALGTDVDMYAPPHIQAQQKQQQTKHRMIALLVVCVICLIIYLWYVGRKEEADEYNPDAKTDGFLGTFLDKTLVKVI
jgi:hypothetical protein